MVSLNPFQPMLPQDCMPIGVIPLRYRHCDEMYDHQSSLFFYHLGELTLNVKAGPDCSLLKKK